MLTIHDQFTPRMRDRLTITGMGLGLVRLLQDARRFEEARTTLYALGDDFQGYVEVADNASQSLCDANQPSESGDRLRTLRISGLVGVQNLEPISC
jgi:hypothetical protein